LKKKDHRLSSRNNKPEKDRAKKSKMDVEGVNLEQIQEFVRENKEQFQEALLRIEHFLETDFQDLPFGVVPRGFTPLMAASTKGNIGIVNDLLQYTGTDVNVQNGFGQTALMLATRYNHEKVVGTLIKAHARVDLRDRNGRTALMHIESEEVGKLLLTAGANVEDTNYKGDTALIECSIKDNAEVLNLLISAGSEINHQNRQGMTALMLSAMAGYTNNVIALLQAGASPEIRDERDRTALDYVETSDGLTDEQKEEMRNAFEQGYLPGAKGAVKKKK
jgi:ankyrin repeat protein